MGISEFLFMLCTFFIAFESSVQEMYTETCWIVVSYVKVGSVKAIYFLGGGGISGSDA